MKKLLLLAGLFAANTSFAQNAIVLASDVSVGSTSSYPKTLTVYNNALYFYADINGFSEFYRYSNGTSSMAFDINPVGHCIDPLWPGEMLSYNNKLYLKANDNVHGNEMFVFDGSTVSLTADISSNAQSGDPRGFTVYNNKMYFDASNANGNDFELWEYNPTNNTATQITDMNPGLNNSHPGSFCVFQNKLFCSAYIPATGHELRTINPSGPVVTLIADLAPGIFDSYPQSLTVVDNKLFFSATTPTSGRELYIYTGSGTPTMVSDLYSGVANGVNSPLYLWNDDIYFSGEDGTSGKQLYKYDVSTGLISLAAVIEMGYNSNPNYFMAFDGKLYFSAANAASGQELWVYDGVSATIVEDFNPGTASTSPTDLTVMDSNLYFAASEPILGRELYMFGDTSSLSVLREQKHGKIVVSPNPATDILNIHFDRNTGSDVNITLINTVGQVVYQATQHAGNKFSLDIKDIAPGLYHCRIVYDNGSKMYSTTINKQE